MNSNVITNVNFITTVWDCIQYTLVMLFRREKFKCSRKEKFHKLQIFREISGRKRTFRHERGIQHNCPLGIAQYGRLCSKEDIRVQ